MLKVVYIETGPSWRMVNWNLTLKSHIFLVCCHCESAIVRTGGSLTSQTLALCPSWLYFTVEWIRRVNTTLYHARHPL